VADATEAAGPHPTASGALIAALRRVARLNDERLADPALARALLHLSRWQAARMSATYADLAVQPRYADAIEFFRTDIYGAADFSRRDADLARAAPVMARMLPDRVLATLAEAMELNALSQELDRRLLAGLSGSTMRFAVADYCRAYRATAARAERERQLRLICEFGAALDDYVKTPLLHAALVMMRQPARLAGLSVLQGFLERGFNAFRKMHGATEFMAAIEGRERGLMDAIFAGDEAPFPGPLPREPAI
jgi:hypothetical protein